MTAQALWQPKYGMPVIKPHSYPQDLNPLAGSVVKSYESIYRVADAKGGQ
jgi:hypothetical protein